MSVIVDLSGLDRLVDRVRALGKLDATPLMRTWMAYIEQDNREGILVKRTDKDGKPLEPVKYRPVTLKPTKIGSKAASDMRNRANARVKRGVFAGFGTHHAGVNNNLTSREYKMLDGPPLAPRRQFSRVITNLKTQYDRSSDGTTWMAYGAWFEVVSAKGVPFLSAHFKGSGRLPVRDLAGVRPEGREKARRAAIAWMADQIRAVGSVSNAA